MGFFKLFMNNSPENYLTYMLNHKLSINFLPLIYTIYWKYTQKTFKKICGVWCRQSGTDCKRELMALCTNGTFFKAVMITYDLLGSNTVCFMFTSWALSLPIPASLLSSLLYLWIACFLLTVQTHTSFNTIDLVIHV